MGLNKTPEKRLEQYQKIHDEAKELFYSKNKDYGDAFSEYGPVGVIIRLGDKIKRYTTITNSAINVESETLRDSLIDLHNYSAMALMLIDED